METHPYVCRGAAIADADGNVALLSNDEGVSSACSFCPSCSPPSTALAAVRRWSATRTAAASAVLGRRRLSSSSDSRRQGASNAWHISAAATHENDASCGLFVSRSAVSALATKCNALRKLPPGVAGPSPSATAVRPCRTARPWDWSCVPPTGACLRSVSI